VPPTVGDYFESCYEQLGHPAITRHSVWAVYLEMLGSTQQDNSLPAAIRPVDDDDELPLLANHVDLPFEKDGTGFNYMGGVDGGRGLGVFI
jgi:hypothetical protein